MAYRDIFLSKQRDSCVEVPSRGQWLNYTIIIIQIQVQGQTLLPVLILQRHKDILF